MTTITIPQKLAQEGDLVILPRREYEELLEYKLLNLKEVPMTPAQKRALKRAERNLARGNTLSIHELKRKLGIKG